MRKVILVLASVIALSSAHAQTGNNQIGIGVDLGIPMGDFGDGSKLGIGGSIKGLYGVGTAGQITLTSGYQAFKAKDETLEPGESATLSIIPILAGYRHNFSGVFIEPQVGLGSTKMKIKSDAGSGSLSETKFSWAIGAGYAASGFEVGVRYQTNKFFEENLNQVAFRVAYNFSLGGASASK